MKIRALQYWDQVRASYWLVPSIMATAAFLLSISLPLLENWMLQKGWQDSFDWLYQAGPEGARAILSTIAGSMITVAGVVFSITIVALSLASSQFGPRLIGNFMRDRGNQLVLGTFTSTFLYCLLVLRTVRGIEDNQFVPHLSAGVGVLLAVISLGVFIYFIHHVAEMIQVANLIRGVGVEMDTAIDRLVLKSPLQNRSSKAADWETESSTSRRSRAQTITSTETGYLVGLDEQGLVEKAALADVVIELLHGIGEHVGRGDRLMRIHAGKLSDEEAVQKLRKAVALNSRRNPTQDLAFAIDHLVEIAIRALSPGINDPFTAVNCLDQIAVALSRLAESEFPGPYLSDQNGTLRLVLRPLSFSDLLHRAMAQIRYYGRSNTMVTVHLLEVLIRVGRRTADRRRRQDLISHAEIIQRSAQENLPDITDRKRVQDLYQKTLGILDPEPASV